VTLTVADDGQGFGPDVDDGFGLAGMRDRVRSVGGTLSVDSTPGTGTTLRARVPVDATVADTGNAARDTGAAVRAEDGTQGVAR
jgi:signal transduction histidine kinase